MLHKTLLPVIFAVLGFGFWFSQDFKVISAGVAIFLFGMLSLEEGFGAFTGGTLERVVRRVTSGRWRSVGFGVASTALMQSSSLVSVIAISFLSAGLITLEAGIGIVFGANLGTTTGAWLIAGFGLKVDIAGYAMPMLVFGVVLLFQPTRKLKGVGYVLCGLGFLFLGIHYMKEGFESFRAALDLSRFAMSGYRGALTFALVGIAATVVMQSSHATLALIITALAGGQVTYENALALAIGSNVGTTVTAVLGALNASEAGKRLAGAHLAFNVLTGMLAIALIYELVEVVSWLARHLGIADDDHTLKLAIFHTLFNAIGIAVMLPLVRPLIAVLQKAIPDRAPDVDQPRYLSDASAEFPDTAIEAVRNETRRVYDAAIDIVGNGLGIRRSADGATHELDPSYDGRPLSGAPSIDALYEKHVKTIYSAIVAFISDTAFSRREEQSAELQWLREANAHIVEAIKAVKHLQKNMRRYVVSGNPNIRAAYDELRAHVASTLDDLAETRGGEDGVLDMLALDALKLAVDEHQQHMMDEMTELIGRRRISPQMGSSLLNDSLYAHDVSMNLVLAAQTLFGAGERDLLHAARSVSLDETERDEMERSTSADPAHEGPNPAGGTR